MTACTDDRRRRIPTRTGSRRAFASLIALVVLGFAGSACAQAFNATPTRTIGPHISGQSGGPWTAADDRSVGATLSGQNGWTSAPGCDPAKLDDEITYAAAHSGHQSLRISNWYTSPCVDSIVSPAFSPVGETGATSGTGTAVTNTVTYGFWFRSVSTSPDPGMSFVIDLSRLASYRLTYLKFEDSTNPDTCPVTACLNLKTIGIESSDDTSAGSPTFTHHYSPALTRGAWYHVVIHATFNNGPLNDVIQTQVFDSANTQVWDDTSGSWQFGYYTGLFNNHLGSPRPVQGPFAADHVAFGLSASSGPGPTSDYSEPARQGIYFDDLSIAPGSGTGYSTNFNADRWVDATAGHDNSDCSDQANPCLTITYAMAQSGAGNTIHIAAGTYAVADGTNLTLGAALSGVQLLGEDPNNKPVITRTAGAKNQPLLVINGAQDVDVENLKFGMDQSFVAEGILASGNVNGLTIKNNHFVDSQSNSAVSSKYSWRNAIAINYANNSQGLGRTDGSTVDVEGNTIDGVADLANGVFLRAGVQLDAGNGVVSGNTITTAVHDIDVRFATATANSSGTSVTIDGNITHGRGLEMSSLNASVTAITVSNNQFNAPVGIDDTTMYAADFALAKLIYNGAGVPTTLSNNTFAGFEGTFRGLLIENYPGVQLTGNTFTPANGASDFRSLVISNKGITTVTPALAPLAMTITAKGNTFNGSGVANAGTAVELLNDNDNSDGADTPSGSGTATFGTLAFGGAGADANHFDSNLGWYFHLDDYHCETVNSPTCSFLDYAGAIGSNAATNTNVRPFGGGVSAANNQFGGVAPANMSAAQQSALLLRTYDFSSNSALGVVNYGFAAKTGVVYVDDDFTGTYGNAVNFGGNPAPACAAASATYGINAFPTLSDALMHVTSGGTICVAAGVYVEADGQGDNIYIGQPVNIYGAQYGVVAAHRSDTGASIIYPGVADPNLSNAGPAAGYQAIVNIASDNVSFDGFVLDGDNPNITSPVTNGVGTANPDVDDGIAAVGSHIDLSHNVIRNLVYAGVDNAEYPASVAAGVGNVIAYNWVYNVDAPSQWGIGIVVLWNYYANIHDNLVDHVRIGIQTNYFFKTTANPVTDAVIANNEVHASATGIYDNYFTNPSSPFTIENNTVFAEDNPAQDGLWVGIVVQGLYDDSTGIIQNNTVDGNALAGSTTRQTAGYRTNEITTTQADNVAIDGGAVAHVDYGVQVTDGAYYAGGMNNIVVKNIAFNDVTWGFYVEDTAKASGETTDYAPKVTVGSGNSFANVTWQGALAGPQATIAYASSVPTLTTMLVRAANAGTRAGLPDSSGKVRSVANALINSGITDVANGGTVTVEPGAFAQNVVVNKDVTLSGPFAGTAGYDASRTGAGEAVIKPASGVSLTLAATGATVDGMTIAGSTAGGSHAITLSGTAVDNLTLSDNRMVDVTDGSGFSAEPGGSCVASGLTISDNLFSNITKTASGSAASDGRGIRLGNGFCGVQITGNHFDTMLYAINANGGTSGPVNDLTITGNDVQGTTGTALVITNTTHASVTNNTISSTTGGGGLFISDSMDDFAATCNTISVTGNGISTLDFFGGMSNTGVRIFDNAISAGTDVNNGLAQSLVIGSNWYGGSAATTSGSNLFVADPLSANPIGSASCGDNTPTQIVRLSGDNQFALVTSAFATPLAGRVEDALGGAVIGEPVTFSPPTSGASANLATPAGATDYNGEFSTTAIANHLAGGYSVSFTTDTSYAGVTPVTFALHNEPANAAIVLDSAGLNVTYDGNPHAVTATTSPAGLAYSISYAGNPVPPTSAGSYYVVATVTDPTYAGTTSGTLTIAREPVTVTLSNLTQTYDGSAKPVTVTTTPSSGVTVSVTYDGGSAAPSAVGDYAVVATVTDANHSGSASALEHIIAAPAPDLAVSISDGRGFQQYGDLLTYTIHVDNLGNTDVTGASVSSVLPLTLQHATPSWTCMASGTASCTASGSGDLNDSAVDIPAGGGVTYVYNAWVNDDQNLVTDVISTTVTVSASGDVDSGNNAATDPTQAVIFRDGFELGGDGAQSSLPVADAQMATTTVGTQDVQTVSLAGAWASAGQVVRVASVRGGDSDDLALQALHLGNRLLVRLAGHGNGQRQLTRWFAVAPRVTQLGAGVARDSNGRLWLLVVGATHDLQVPLDAASAKLRIHAVSRKR